LTAAFFFTGDVAHEVGAGGNRAFWNIKSTPMRNALLPLLQQVAAAAAHTHEHPRRPAGLNALTGAARRLNRPGE
jgi:hypothetical protein